MLRGIDPKELARNGYVKYDVETGLSADGRTLCFIFDEEKAIIQALRKALGGQYPKDLSVEIRISKNTEPITFTVRR